MLSRTEYEEILQIRREFEALRAEYRSLKAGFRRDQPRWPKRSGPTSGRWSGGPGAGSSDRGPTTDLSAMARSPRLLFDSPKRPNAPLPAPYFSTGPQAPRDPITIDNKAQTGISTVDETTEKLKTILERVVNDRPEGFGPEYGKTIHYDFASAVKSENLSGIGTDGVEHTFPEDGTRYGSKDTVRTDIILRNDIGDVIAIYDVKTGTAKLDAVRVQELRDKTGVGLHTPVIEMHIQRGLSLKAQTENGRHFWIITLRLWNPWIRGIANRAAGATYSSSQ